MLSNRFSHRCFKRPYAHGRDAVAPLPNAPANHPVSGLPLLFHWIALGRAVIAMAAVRIRTCDEPGEIIDRSDIRPPTDVMAITSLPK